MEKSLVQLEADLWLAQRAHRRNPTDESAAALKALGDQIASLKEEVVELEIETEKEPKPKKEIKPKKESKPKKGSKTKGEVEDDKKKEQE